MAIGHVFDGISGLSGFSRVHRELLCAMPALALRSMGAEGLYVALCFGAHDGAPQRPALQRHCRVGWGMGACAALGAAIGGSWDEHEEMPGKYGCEAGARVRLDATLPAPDAWAGVVHRLARAGRELAVPALDGAEISTPWADTKLDIFH